MIIYSALFCYKNHRFHLVMLDFSSTNCFQIRGHLFWNAFALQLGLQKNGEFTTAHSNRFQVTYLHHYKLTVYLLLKHLLTPKFQPLYLPLSTAEGGSLLLSLLSSQRSWGQGRKLPLRFIFFFSCAPCIDFFEVLMVKWGLNLCGHIADGYGHVRCSAWWYGQGIAHDTLCMGL